MASERALRLALVAAGARLSGAGLIRAGEGNLSARLDADRCMVTPSGCDKGRLRALDLLIQPLAGDPVAGASMETRLHLAVYRARPEVGAIVHAHPSAVLALAARGGEPDVGLLLESERLLGPVGRVEPSAPGSQDLARRVADALADRDACVLVRHGVVAVAADLELALLRVELLEQLAWLSLAGLSR